MALIKCPECGREGVSDSAESCPSCGYNIKAHFQKIQMEEVERQKQQEELARQQAEEAKREKEEYERQNKYVTCPECGKSFKEIQRICPSCGFSLDDEEAVKRKKEIEILRNEAKSNDWIWDALKAVGVFALGLLLMFLGKEMDDTLSKIFSIIMILGTLYPMGQLKFDIDSKNNAKKNLALAEKNYYEYEEQQKKIIAEMYGNQKPYVPPVTNNKIKCPMCGSTNTVKISTMNRAASVAMVGMASSKIGKQYQCKDCGHKW